MAMVLLGFSKLIIICVAVLTATFLVGFFIGYSKGLDHGIEYSVYRTITEIGKLFEKRGMKELYEETLKEIKNE